MNNKNRRQFFDTREAVAEWLYNYEVSKYTINDDLSVDVNDDVDISRKNLEIIPVNFGNVTGSFWCEENNLISLIGAPKTVGKDFVCNNNKIINLSGSPKSVGGNFWCSNNKITNFRGVPISVAENFTCNNNEIVDLTDFLKTNIGGEIRVRLNEETFKNKELYDFLNKYFNKLFERVEIEFKTLKHYLEKLELEKNLKISDNIKSSKLIKKPYL